MAAKVQDMLAGIKEANEEVIFLLALGWYLAKGGNYIELPFKLQSGVDEYQPLIGQAAMEMAAASKREVH